MDAATAIFEQIRPLVYKLDEAERFALIRSIALLEPEEQENDTSAEDKESALLLEEQTAWFARPKRERQQYQGQYVAIHQRAVVDHDQDRRALYIRVRQRFGETPVLLIPADWDAVPELTIHSTRRVQ